MEGMLLCSLIVTLVHELYNVWIVLVMMAATEKT